MNPYHVAFSEAKSAVKSQNILENAQEFETIADAVADCSLIVGTTSIGPRALEHPLRRLETGGRIIAKKLASAPVALLFGSEKFGLSNEDMSYCHWLMRIPTREEHGSMNLGQAVAVCLYEIMRSPSAAPREAGSKRLCKRRGDGARDGAARRSAGAFRLRACARRGLDEDENPPIGPAHGLEHARRRGMARNAAADQVEVVKLKFL